MSDKLRIVSIVAEKSVGPRSGTFELSRAPTVEVATMPAVAPYTLSMDGALLTITSSHKDIDKPAIQRIEDRIEEAEKERQKDSNNSAFERERDIRQLSDNTGLPLGKR